MKTEDFPKVVRRVLEDEEFSVVDIDIKRDIDFVHPDVLAFGKPRDEKPPLIADIHQHNFKEMTINIFNILCKEKINVVITDDNDLKKEHFLLLDCLFGLLCQYIAKNNKDVEGVLDAGLLRFYFEGDLGKEFATLQSFIGDVIFDQILDVVKTNPAAWQYWNDEVDYSLEDVPEEMKSLMPLPNINMIAQMDEETGACYDSQSFINYDCGFTADVGWYRYKKIAEKLDMMNTEITFPNANKLLNTIDDFQKFKNLTYEMVNDRAKEIFDDLEDHLLIYKESD